MLEGRQLMATFAVTSLQGAGAGSLRQAILDANSHPGADTIDFAVSGTILPGRVALPAITDAVDIDGTSAPTYAGTPAVTVDFRGKKGLLFAAGADGSTLSSLSLVGASNAGVTLNASNITVEGNYIGLRADGVSVSGNRGDGIQINASSHGDLIGHSDPVTGVNFYLPSDVVLVNTGSTAPQPVTSWQGIREFGTGGDYLITGNSGTNGLLYVGPISGTGGTAYEVNYPNTATATTTSTSVYGPDDLGNGVLRLVGSYKTGDGVVNGFVFQGTVADLSNPANYRTIDGPGAQITYVHSTMGDLAVGNTDGPEGNFPIASGHAFLYNVATNTFLPGISYPGSTTTSAYGIWHNAGTSYTIVGGYSTLLNPGSALSHGFMVDYDSATGLYSNWTSFNYPNGVVGQDYITHFEGISSDQKGVYTLVADSLQTGSSNPAQGSLVTVRRNADGTFSPGAWVDLTYPGVRGIASANSVAGNQVVGIVIGAAVGTSSPGIFAYQATVNTAFQRSNVISGNGGNGIGIYGASDNQVAMNEIGTDASGTIARANGKNGILITNSASRNLIGGQATGGNDPTGSVFVRPPQGNLISGNRGSGVLINNGATQNVLSGNFIGTTASGNSALGNRQDGVTIDRASGNQLLGCTLFQNPFVFYNVISGNGGNGVRVNNSNDTTIQANFLGVGANNATVVANNGDGLLVSGSSANTQVGGVIPLGNVIAGNNKNGIEVSGTASGFVSFNTFAGLYAFGAAAPNRRDGILITSSGGNNTVRTSIVSGNYGNGIELGGNATGVQITEAAIGTNTNITAAMPNGGDGILITGRAHGNAIGGFQPSVVPQVTISSNHRYGIEVTGSARDNTVFHTYIGTDFNGTAALGNNLGGIYLGRGTSSTTIGGESALAQVQILNSVGGAGVTMATSSNNAVLGDVIRNNAGGGVFISGGRNNRVGSTTSENAITGNGGDGLFVTGSVSGTQVLGNDIAGGTGNGVSLSGAKGVTIGGTSPGSGNRVFSNRGFGLLATGVGTGSVIQGNVILLNTQGDVDLSGSRGYTYIPKAATAADLVG